MKSKKAKRAELRIHSMIALFSCLPREKQQRVLDTVLNMIAENRGKRAAADQHDTSIQIDAPGSLTTSPIARDGPLGECKMISLQERRGVRD